MYKMLYCIYGFCRFNAIKKIFNFFGYELQYDIMISKQWKLQGIFGGGVQDMQISSDLPSLPFSP
jgi:hypothetical protein